MIDLNLDMMDEGRSVPWFIRLQAAILRRAIVDWVLYAEHSDPKLQRVGGSAGAWLFGPSSYKDFSSFTTVCSIIGVEPHIIRGKIRGLSEDEVRKLRGMEFGDG